MAYYDEKRAIDDINPYPDSLMDENIPEFIRVHLTQLKYMCDGYLAQLEKAWWDREED